MNSDQPRYYRKVIRIRGQDSPNVRLAIAQQEQGLEPTNELVVPGVLSWADYVKRRATWDAVRQSIGLDAQFWSGSEVLLYPPTWLDAAERLWQFLRINKIPRRPVSMGVDPAEGGDKTTMAVVDELGLVELVSKRTPNTAVITRDAIAFGRKHSVPPERWYFDRGGGKVHADRLREMGYDVKTVAFGESLTSQEPRKTKRQLRFQEKIDHREGKYAYFNRRSEMYGILSLLLDPSAVEFPSLLPVRLAQQQAQGYKGFSLPPASFDPVYGELRYQLSKIPRRLDSEGRLKMLPKSRGTTKNNEQTLTDIIGHSPDEADALVLAVYGLTHEIKRVVAGTFL